MKGSFKFKQKMCHIYIYFCLSKTPQGGYSQRGCNNEFGFAMSDFKETGKKPWRDDLMGIDEDAYSVIERKNGVGDIDSCLIHIDVAKR